VPLKGAAHWKNLAPIQIRTLPDIAVALGCCRRVPRRGVPAPQRSMAPWSELARWRPRRAM